MTARNDSSALVQAGRRRASPSSTSSSGRPRRPRGCRPPRHGAPPHPCTAPPWPPLRERRGRAASTRSSSPRTSARPRCGRSCSTASARAPGSSSPEGEWSRPRAAGRGGPPRAWVADDCGAGEHTTLDNFTSVSTVGLGGYNGSSGSLSGEISRPTRGATVERCFVLLIGV